MLPAGRRPQPASRWRHVHLRPPGPRKRQPSAVAVATAPPRPHAAATSACCQPPAALTLTRSSAAAPPPAPRQVPPHKLNYRRVHALRRSQRRSHARPSASAAAAHAPLSYTCSTVSLDG
eukprot:scaffold1782_cov123-Isochrysis_galbana.AAC.7